MIGSWCRDKEMRALIGVNAACGPTYEASIMTTGLAMMQLIDTITLPGAYEATRIFLGGDRLASPGQASGGDRFLLAGLKWVDGSPVDPAMWQDWLAAAQSVKQEALEQP